MGHQLALSLGNLPCQINRGHKIVEVSAMEITKGAIVRKECESTEYKEVLCIGDDCTDESMFSEAPPQAHTVRVGPGESCARFRLSSPAEVRKFLKLILDQTHPRGIIDKTSPGRHESMRARIDPAIVPT